MSWDYDMQKRLVMAIEAVAKHLEPKPDDTLKRLQAVEESLNRMASVIQKAKVVVQTNDPWHGHPFETVQHQERRL